MGELGDFLELLQRSSTSFATAKGEFRVLKDVVVAQRAMQDLAQRSPRRSRTVGGGSGSFSGSFFAPLGDDEGPEEPMLSSVRVWLERPDRYREESGEGDELGILVRDRERWWSYDPFMGAMTNEGEGESSRSMASGQLEALFTPVSLSAALEFEPLGSGETAGLSTVRARGHPHPEAGMFGSRALPSIGLGADDYEIEVDAKRGVVLRLSAWFKGESLISVEAARVSFDEPLEPDTFVFTAPDGAAPALERRAEPEHIPVHEAAQRAPFPVFVIADVSEPWASFAIFTPARERPPVPAEVTLNYVAGNGAGTVIVRQRAQADATTSPIAAQPIEREITREGLTIGITKALGTFSAVQLVREGTQIEIFSPDLDTDRLIALATRLRPAPKQPPPI